MCGTINGSLAIAVQREVSDLRDCKGNGVQRKLHQSYAFSGTGRDRMVRDESLFSDGAEARGLEKRSAHTDLGQIPKGQLVKKVRTQKMRRAGARLAAVSVMQSSLTEKSYVNTKWNEYSNTTFSPVGGKHLPSS